MPRHRTLRASLDRILPAAVFLTAFAYLAAFHRFGWFLEDEGVLYYHYLRVYQGQVPYRDFFTGATPLSYYLHSWAFSLFGVSIQTTRLLLAVVHAVTAVGLYALARRVSTRGFALVAPILFVVMEPNDIVWTYSLHNCPYPTWYALTFTVLGTWTLLRAVETRREAIRSGWLFVTGLLGGCALLSKQNAGVFFLWGVSGFLASWPVPSTASKTAEPFMQRRLRIAYLWLIPLSALLMVRRYANVATLAAFVLPLVLLAAMGMHRPFGQAAWRTMAIGFFSVGAGLTVAIAPWLGFLSKVMPLGDFLGTVAALGADVERNLYQPFPALRLSILILVPISLWVLRGWLVNCLPGAWFGATGRRIRALLIPHRVLRFSLAYFSISLLIATMLLLRSAAGQSRWQIYSIAAGALDVLFAYGAILILVGALAVLSRRFHEGGQEGDVERELLLGVLWIAAASFLVYYPRMDTAHLLGALPLLYVVGAGLLPSVRRGITTALPERRLAAARIGFNVACWIAIAVIVAAKSFPKMYGSAACAQSDGRSQVGAARVEWLRFERAELCLPVHDNERQRRLVTSFRDMVHYLRDVTRSDEPIFAFPALPMVYFLGERENPTRHDYFFGNNVSRHEQEGLIHTLEDKRVSALVVTQNRRDYFVRKSFEYTQPIWLYLRGYYTLERRFGPYDFLRRRERPG